MFLELNKQLININSIDRIKCYDDDTSHGVCICSYGNFHIDISINGKCYTFDYKSSEARNKRYEEIKSLILKSGETIYKGE